MRSSFKTAMTVAVCVFLAWPVLAQETEEKGTPQGRPVAKAKKAAGAAAARPQAAGQIAPSGPSPVVLDDVRRAEEAVATGRGLSYDPEGRRDPFVSPAEAVEFEQVGQCEGEGSECWLISEIALVGIMGRRGGAVALVVGPDGYGASLRAGNKLYDGEVLRVDSVRGVVAFRQQVSDPTRIKPYRDIEKKLSNTGEGGL
jgi:hypothetical protein